MFPDRIGAGKCKVRFNQEKLISSLNSAFRNIIHSFILHLSLLFFIFPGCSDERIIKEDKLVLMYTDLLIIQDTVVLDDKGVDSLRQSVFKKYNVTEKDYQNTIDYYNEDLERWEEFFDEVTAHIEKRSLSPPSPKERAFKKNE